MNILPTMAYVSENDFDSVNLGDDDDDNNDKMDDDDDDHDADSMGGSPPRLSISAIATSLVESRFILTALELHSELTERGKESNFLRDYFSNPVHFEQPLPQLTEPSFQPSQLSRSNSVQTLESLEFSRYSDDGDRVKDEKIAILEFELRKAKETIKSLRSQITNDATFSTPVVGRSGDGSVPSISAAHVTSPMREHEKRAVNFLVNEYLLQANCKLAAITLADENEDNQDLDDWDDVSLNVPRPPPLLAIYRDFMKGGSGGGGEASKAAKTEPSIDAETSTDLSMKEIETSLSKVDAREKEISHLRHELTTKEEENSGLKTQNKRLDREIASLMKDGGDVCRSRSVSNVSFGGGGGAAAFVGAAATASYTAAAASIANVVLEDVVLEDSQEEIQLTITDASTADVFNEDLEEEVNPSASIKFPELQSVYRRSLLNLIYGHLDGEKCASSLIPGALSTVDSTSLIDAAAAAAAASSFAETLFNNMLPLLSRTLSNVVPNILVAKRGDVVPLLVATIVALHEAPLPPPSLEAAASSTLSSEAAASLRRESRDLLLHTLFNLVKKPDSDQRRLILSGCLEYAQRVGPVCVEVEFLPQCWEQIGHKHDERRLLVAEAVGVLAAYVSPSTVTSLLSSIAQTLLTDRNPGVRAAALKSLSVAWTYVETPEKFSVGLNVLLDAAFTSVRPSPVGRIALDVFLPTFSLWTLNHEGLFQSFVEGLLEKVRQRCGDLPQVSAAKSVYLEKGSTSGGGVVGVEFFSSSSSIKSYSSSSPTRSSESIRKTESEILHLIKILARLTSFALLRVLDDLSVDEDRLSSIFEHSSTLSSTASASTTTTTSLFDPASIFGSGSSALHQIHRKMTYFRALQKDGFEDGSELSVTINAAAAAANVTPAAVKTSSKTITSIQWLIQLTRQLVVLTKSVHPLRTRLLSGLASLFHRLREILGDEFVRRYVLGGWYKHREDEEQPHELLIPYDLESSTLPVFVVGIFSSSFLLSSSSSDDSSSSLRSRFFSLLHRIFIQASLKAKCVDALVSSFLLSYAMIPSTRQPVIDILRETVVHSSHVVRISTASLLRFLLPLLEDDLVSAQILPALITLASDSDVRVRIAAIPAFGAILDRGSDDDDDIGLGGGGFALDGIFRRSSSSSPSFHCKPPTLLIDEDVEATESSASNNIDAANASHRPLPVVPFPRRGDIVERVLLQFQAFLSDPVFRDNLPLRVRVVRTFGAIGPNVEASVREDFLLPRLAALAAENNGLSSSSALSSSSSSSIDNFGDRKTEMALALLESYSAISRCSIPAQLIGETMLPGMRCLKEDVKEVAPQYEEAVVKMIADFEGKASWGGGGGVGGGGSDRKQRGSSVSSLTSSSSSGAVSSMASQADDVKAKILKGWQEGSKFLSGKKK